MRISRGQFVRKWGHHFEGLRLITCLSLLAGLASTLIGARAGATAADEDFHQLQSRVNSALLDVYEGDISQETKQVLVQEWKSFADDLTDPSGQALVHGDFSQGSLEDAAQDLGKRRSLMQHLAAMEMLKNQEAGNVPTTRLWRDLITLPQFANADEGGLLLQQTPEQVRQQGVTQALAKEYIGWQVARTRQLLDRFQQALAGGEANDAFVRANFAEIQTLAQFPPVLLKAAGLKASAPQNIPLPVLQKPYNSPLALADVASWRDRVEATLPNLLSAEDVERLNRLLVRLVQIVPKEYSNAGIQNGQILIRLEYQEAQQFTQQAQSLVNELSPVWQRDQHAAYTRYHAELVGKLADLARKIDQLEPNDVIGAAAGDVRSLLENRFGLSARRMGNKSMVVDETALEVRSSLNNSLAAAQAGHWNEAESLRLDAYTSFDSEIEVRVLPRNPELAMRTERSFLDGGQGSPGIKALLDQHTSMEELTKGYETALKNMDECVAELKVAVSPTTVGFTAFTIIAREGMEAIIILTALLAGLRGEENRPIRRWVSGGALFGVFLSLITFWLSQTLIQSLVRYGEKLEAVVSILAVVILFMVTNWVFHKFYWVEWNARLRSLSRNAQQVRAPVWEIFALLGVGFLTVYREGFETTVFMQSLLLEGGHTPVVLGVAAGFLFIGTVGTLIFLFGVKLPFRKLLVITGVLVVSIMVTFLGSTVRLFQTVGWLPIHPIPSLHIPSWAGLWLGIYPSWEGILIPPLALVYVGGAWLLVKIQARRASGENPMEKEVRQGPLQFAPSKTL